MIQMYSENLTQKLFHLFIHGNFFLFEFLITFLTVLLCNINALDILNSIDFFLIVI